MDLFETKLFFHVGAFVFKQFVAVENSLHCRIAVILFLSLWDCFQKVSADMGPVTALFGFFYLVDIKFAHCLWIAKNLKNK